MKDTSDSVTTNAPVLRVTQLDTLELDESLLATIKQSINQDLFKYIQTNFFQKYHTELYAAVKLLLWYHTYFKTGQTVSQSILNWSYVSNEKSLLVHKIAHACFYCLDEWFEERFHVLVKWLFNKFRQPTTGFDEQERKLDRCLLLIRIVFKIGSFLTYLKFLFDGKYLNLWQALLKLRAVYTREQLMRNYDHEISEKEMLWQTYFSLFKLLDSLVDLNKIYRNFFKSLKKKPTDEQRSNFNQNLCAICENHPTMVHCSINYDQTNSCKHVFCYFCIRRALNETENRYVCTVCANIINDCEVFINKNNS